MSRDRVLQAARTRFAERSFATTTVRAIAAAAGVNPALVLRLFGSKRELFLATLHLPTRLRDDMAELVGSDPDDLGERLVRRYLALWQDPVTGPSVTAMV
ncbi:TetR/AcrR family transcriptional regulator [Streptomyces justiciae]|uniref:Helix-turn-helix domain-containing protein n=1 Tax=Streptomyces justiciae TaxID=2780140 RepID=A0ABU3M5W5_9ACTN|nr:helix-turn-helix domain-containing protein [Streptomyces justiciae]MDT7846743.1 helix-turn-helix domain-containing protein [Streptomyces justiciae]